MLEEHGSFRRNFTSFDKVVSCNTSGYLYSITLLLFVCSFLFSLSLVHVIRFKRFLCLNTCYFPAWLKCRNEF